MNARKPPRLAIWLLNRWGMTRQNPPLVGDLFEEFRSGRSRAWFWRQTLIVILTGFARNARLYRRLLAARLIAWASAASVTFALWWFHAPPRVDGFVALGCALVVLVAWGWAIVGRKRGPRSSEAEDLEFWDELDRDEARCLQRFLMGVLGSLWFLIIVALYCGLAGLIAALDGPISLWIFIYWQAVWLFQSFSDVLVPRKEPGRSYLLLTLEKS